MVERIIEKNSLEDLLNMTVEQKLSFWCNFGFLEGIEDSDKMELSKLYHEMVIYLLVNGGKYNFKHMSYIVFPIIRRCFQRGIANFYTPVKLCDFIENTFDVLTSEIAKWFDDDEKIDIEVEYSILISKIFSRN